MTLAEPNRAKVACFSGLFLVRVLPAPPLLQALVFSWPPIVLLLVDVLSCDSQAPASTVAARSSSTPGQALAAWVRGCSPTKVLPPPSPEA